MLKRELSKKNSDHTVCCFQEKNVSLSTRGNILTLQTAHGNLLLLFQMVLIPSINF